MVIMLVVEEGSPIAKEYKKNNDNDNLALVNIRTSVDYSMP